MEHISTPTRSIFDFLKPKQQREDPSGPEGRSAAETRQKDHVQMLLLYRVCSTLVHSGVGINKSVDVIHHTLLGFLLFGGGKDLIPPIGTTESVFLSGFRKEKSHDQRS